MSSVLGVMGGTRAGKQDTSYLYIDGAYLERLAKDFQKAYNIENLDAIFNPKALIAHHERVYYYDALPAKKKNQSDEEFKLIFEEKRQQLEKIARFENFFWRPGKSKFDSRLKKLTQKGVDVALATDMMSHAFRGIVKKVTLLAGDLDFFRVLEVLVDEGIKVELLCAKNSVSNELFDVVDKATFINDDRIATWYNQGITSTWRPKGPVKRSKGRAFAGDIVGAYMDEQVLMGSSAGEFRVLIKNNHLTYSSFDKHNLLQYIQRNYDGLSLYD